MTAQRVQLLAGARRSGDHGGIQHLLGREVVILELRELPRCLCARLEHHFDLAHQQHRHQHDQRDLDGEPALAGVAALYLQGSSTASPTTVRNAIVNSATPGVLSGVGSGSPNLLLYSLFGSAPPPPPPPSGCSLAESYNGSLSGTGDYDTHPGGTYFYTSRSGTHRGCLRGPSGSDFDLYLYKWNGFNWSVVARGETSSSSEDVAYNGTAGYYLWEVASYSGSGSYSFGMTRL